jgi:hypothetical protein
MQPNGKRTNDSTTAPTGNERPTNRVTVADAGRLLGLSAEAVRMRIKRGTLASEKVDGTVYVLLDSDQSEPDEDQASDQTGNRTPDLTAEQTELAKILHEQCPTYESSWTRSVKRIGRTGGSSPGWCNGYPNWRRQRLMRLQTGLRAARRSDRAVVGPQGEDAGQETAKSSPWWKR